MVETLFPPIGTLADQTSSIGASNNDTHAPVNTNDDDEPQSDRPIQEIESLCMQCREQGMTRLLLTAIPYFREVVLMSFHCQHCGASNNEIQSAGGVQDQGVTYTVRVLSRADLDRQLVRSPTCTVRIPEYELTLPPISNISSGGRLTTVEGLLREIVKDLDADQAGRKIENEATWSGIEQLLNNLREVLGDDAKEDSRDEVGEQPMPGFTIILDDPAGNSFIEFVGGMADPKWNMRSYDRTRQDDIELGLVAEHEDGGDNDEEETPDENIFVFPGSCSSCHHPIETRMKKVTIPHFKDVLIMSTNCDRCGYRDNEVKSGSAISPQGKRITLKVADREDLSRDILKSDSAALEVPEIELALKSGTLGGRFTTVEGILTQVYEELSEKVFVGDSSVEDVTGRVAFETFLGRLKSVKSASVPFTLILDDPLANSYIQSLYAPEPDPAITVECYDRTWEQSEELGLNDMRVEGYGEE